MSLVERALKKLQDSRASAPVPSGVSAPLPSVPAARIQTIAPGPKADHNAPPQPPRKVVVIDREALRRMELIAPKDLERQIAGEYQQIKRPLVPHALGRAETPIAKGNIVMLASALPGEGKTFTSLNLALSMALEKDIQVLLIDADVAKPHITRLLGLENEPGLLELLSDHSLDPESLVLPTNVPGLSVLPSGRYRDNATELLASERMEQVALKLGDMRLRRMVLLDSPPLLLSTESRAAIGAVGQIVLVVRSGMTPQKAVLDAIGLVGDAKPVSLILNQSEAATAGAYYGYGAYGAGESTPNS
jgi:protein-tyrosine kinase